MPNFSVPSLLVCTPPSSLSLCVHWHSLSCVRFCVLVLHTRQYHMYYSSCIHAISSITLYIPIIRIMATSMILPVGRKIGEMIEQLVEMCRVGYIMAPLIMTTITVCISQTLCHFACKLTPCWQL